MSKVTAILASYNSQSIIGQALGALLAEPLIAEIIVVDNCSEDDTVEYIKEEFPKVRVVENKRNEGFGRANNRGLAMVKTPYALLINPDATLEEGALETLLDAADKYHDAAILAPQLVDGDGAMQVNYKRSVFVREKNRKVRDTPEKVGDLCVEYLAGAVMLWRISQMRVVDFFDPNIFLYYEDDDICLRTRKAKYSNVLVAKARAVHLKGASSGEHDSRAERFKQHHMIWSRLYLEKKYKGATAAAKLARKREIAYSFKAAFYFLTRNEMKFSRYRGRLKGIAAFKLNPPK